MLIEFIIKYWLEFVFGLISFGITTGATIICKKYKKKVEERQEQLNKQISDNIDKALAESQRSILKIIQEEEDKTKASDEAITNQMLAIQANLNTLTDGVLSIQGHQFKEQCRALLKDEHEITLEEFEHITNEHVVYNKLHGNHEGDGLYDLVETKYKANLQK